ncbi:hypothetical protein FA95DRAFT_1567298 [Auriscalpium vulgare]|uniref:Uncharacterized protein n=1 Tax=Auriscalpium vulgare TaxID=40419 RepID=A0ACB8R6H8_9AGAM|nr:hypothetical protein FA95DRAFT_1567298 [Auriscalpium vulgare]
MPIYVRISRELVHHDLPTEKPYQCSCCNKTTRFGGRPALWLLACLGFRGIHAQTICASCTTILATYASLEFNLEYRLRPEKRRLIYSGPEGSIPRPDTSFMPTDEAIRLIHIRDIVLCRPRMNERRFQSQFPTVPISQIPNKLCTWPAHSGGGLGAIPHPLADMRQPTPTIQPTTAGQDVVVEETAPVPPQGSNPAPSPVTPVQAAANPQSFTPASPFTAWVQDWSRKVEAQRDNFSDIYSPRLSMMVPGYAALVDENAIVVDSESEAERYTATDGGTAPRWNCRSYQTVIYVTY